MKAVRRSLLEADVSVQVADSFIKRVEQHAAGREVLKSLRPLNSRAGRLRRVVSVDGSG